MAIKRPGRLGRRPRSIAGRLRARFASIRAAARQSRSDESDLRRAWSRCLRGRDGDDRPIVAVSYATSPPRAPADLARSHPSAQLIEIAADDPDAHVRLTAAAPLDLIIEVGKRNVRGRFLDAFYQLRPGGSLIVRDRAAIRELLADATRLRDQKVPRVPRGSALHNSDAHHLGTLSAGVTSVGRYLVVRRGEGTALAKLSEPDMNTFLAGESAGRDRVLQVIKAQPFESRCTLREQPDPPRAGFPGRYATIDASLRLYHDSVVSPGGVISTDRFIAPDSFRHNQNRRLRNRVLIEIAPRFARPEHDTADLPTLSGTYFHLDNEFRGHFGHLMTEQLSRFWGWPYAKALDPDAKVVLCINKGRELRNWELEIYAAGGISRDDIVFLRGPARVERLVSGTPLLSNPHYVHPMIEQTWREVGDRLVAKARDIALPTRFFCARRLDKRGCHNAAEVEHLFTQRGFAIVYPEDHSIPDQVRLFRNAEVIGGYAGSALFTLCLTLEPKHVIMIGSQAYTARNEYLIASVLGHRIDSITCRPDNPDSYQSTYRFDPAREGEALRRIFDSLPPPAA